jgi:hypothetical protein
MQELIQIIECLNEKELDKINAYVDKLPFSPSTVFGNENNTNVRKDIRSSNGCTLKDDSHIADLIHKKMNEALIEYQLRVAKVNDIFKYYPVIGGFDTVSHREGIQILDYEKNQEYKFHHDVSDDINSKEYNRHFTVLIYLKNAEKGGGTIFNHNNFKPPVGNALIFPSNWCYPHSGEKVTKGKKRVAVTWYYVEHA